MGFELSQIVNTKSQPVPVSTLGNKNNIVVGASNVAPLAEVIHFQTTKPFIVDSLSWSTNIRNKVKLSINVIVNGEEVILADITSNGGGTIGLYPQSLIDHGATLFNTLAYDTVNNNYKFTLKNSLYCPEGVKIKSISIETVETYKSAIVVIGREI